MKNIPIPGIPHFDDIIINTARCEALAIIIKGDKDSANATPPLLSETDIQKKRDYFRTREILGQPIGKIVKHHIFRDMDKDKRTANGDTTVYAYAGTMVYAHADIYDTVRYRYDIGPVTGSFAQCPNKDLLPSYNTETGEALAKKRLQVVLALGRAFCNGLMTPTEAMAAKIYERSLHHLVVLLWEKGHLGNISDGDLSQLGWPVNSDKLRRLTPQQEKEVDILIEKYQKHYNIYIPAGFSIEAEHLPAMSACAAVYEGWADALSLDEADLSDEWIDFLIYVCLYVSTNARSTLLTLFVVLHCHPERPQAIRCHMAIPPRYPRQLHCILEECDCPSPLHQH